MSLIKCMIVDDEPIARDILSQHIQATEGLQLVKTCIHPVEAYEGLHEFPIDLVFLDIQMPLLSGIDFLKSLANPPLVVFTTAYTNYALDGYEFNAADYLLKPITYKRFLQAVQKVRSRMIKPKAMEEVIQQPHYVFIKSNGKLIKVDYQDILYLRADGDFTWFKIKQKEIFASVSLKDFEENNSYPSLVRIHRSFMVNLARIDAVKGNMVEINKEDIPIGSIYRTALLKTMGI
ncbi:DNA-binding response regulator [Pedobacter sp. HMWF019]|uniref:LytR/AlgR family response regulator transcription factor n=1 Tax=Pedobacter sp. HMWF019 TaxID=2056856 RepID=UPI000D37584B|nr:response regulator transcription factor [Pedobacter sp. HMWF019]PTT00343.1 DNA-binding response regulator [Pedobacter sp. HMWF019]